MIYIKILLQDIIPKDIDLFKGLYFDKDGLHKITFNKYDPDGYDIYGFDKDGCDIYGNKKNQVKLKLAKQNLLKTKKEKDTSIYLLLYLKYILILVQKN